MYNKIIKTEPIKLTTQQLKKELIKLQDWKLIKFPVEKSNSLNQDTKQIFEEALYKKFHFKGFTHTWAFLSKVSLNSHLVGHHPTITYSYSDVEVKLFTHDKNGICDIDVKFAERIENFHKESRCEK